MSGYRLSPAARDDVIAITDWIAEDDLAAAFRLRDRLFHAFASLAAMPGMGHVRDDVVPRRSGLRFWSVGPYLVVYRQQPKGIEIVRVVHGARDLPRIFEEG